jgi:hypothetical protein
VRAPSRQPIPAGRRDRQIRRIEAKGNVIVIQKDQNAPRAKF